MSALRPILIGILAAIAIVAVLRLAPRCKADDHGSDRALYVGGMLVAGCPVRR